MNPYELTARSMGLTAIDALFTAVEDDGESFEIRRQGEPVAVVIPFDEWQRVRDAYVLQEVRYGHTTEVPL